MPGLPPLREELALLPGALLADGQPSWTLHDPVRQQFFQIDWATFEILQRWWMGDAERIAADVDRHSTLRLQPEDVQEVARFLVAQQLVRTEGVSTPRQMAERVQRLQGSAWQWLLHRYLFFRVPLVRPDAWLGRWLPLANLCFTRGFLFATLAALLWGSSQVARQWETFHATLVDTFDLPGLMAYALALTLVKSLHELGHAFTAKRFGCRVPTMGVAFLVMWPVAYTDTNDAWRLTDRLKRLKVASAGILTELALACWATAAWALLPDGPARAAMFVLATTSWVATLAVNASPFLRFDGYFILADALDLPNLHERSFALARWRLRELLFDLREPAPEHLGPRRTRALILFAWAVWIYRLGLFIGIALLVYHFFFKALGVLLFMVEIAWFILSPIRAELKAWRSRWPAIHQRRRWLGTLAVLGGLAVLLAVPLPTRVGAQAILRPVQMWPVHAPSAARLEAMPHGEGARIERGAVIARLHAPELLARRQALAVRVEQGQWAAAAAGVDEAARQRLQVQEQAARSAQAELRSLDTELARYTPRAPFAGRLRGVDPELMPGQWLARNERLGVLVPEDGRWVVETWLDEDAVQRVRAGDDALFIPEGASGSVLRLSVSAIERDAARVLPRPELSTLFGGHLSVREQGREFFPERAVYRVTFEVPRHAGTLIERGRVSVQGRSESLVARYARQAAAVAVRELSF